MIFTDLRFLALFVLCWLTFFWLPRHWRAFVLAFWGAIFYLLYAGTFFAVSIALTVLVFMSGRRAVAWLASAVIIALLAYFKLLSSAAPGDVATLDTTSIFLPLGFSYMAFELLHVVIDRRRGQIRSIRWTDLLAFVFFAPARIAGPIKRLPQFAEAVADAELTIENVYHGILRILLGLVKKFLADTLALVASEGPSVGTPRRAWAIVFAFSLEIFLDFSAYSDIAIGFARTIGIRLPENFRWPYMSRNIREFWDRWHITLSHWVRDYIFLPMGSRLFRTQMRRFPLIIAATTYLVTFVIVGAWHGLTAAFLLWGLYHGTLLALYKVVQGITPRQLATQRWYRSRPANIVSAALTFACVTIGWVPFMLPLHSAARLLTLMFGFGK